MPLMYLHLTPNAFTESQLQRAVELITEAALRAESIPDEPQLRLRSVIIINELAQKHFYMGGNLGYAQVRGAFLHLFVGVGVMDGHRRSQLVADVHTALETAANDGSRTDQRRVVSSVVISDVPEGFWGQDGAVRRLPEMAAVAGFEHLRSIAAPSPHRVSPIVP